MSVSSAYCTHTTELTLCLPASAIGGTLIIILMIMRRMFCPLHTPAEEHACSFDYQVGHQEYLYLIWLDVNDISDFNIDFLKQKGEARDQIEEGNPKV